MNRKMYLRPGPTDVSSDLYNKSADYGCWENCESLLSGAIRIITKDKEVPDAYIHI